MAAGEKPNGKETLELKIVVEVSRFDTLRRTRGLILYRSKADSLSRTLFVGCQHSNLLEVTALKRPLIVPT